ncbi:MAG: DUF6790 family protein [Steroidobacteraceae bacterium]|jgi:hypothetical protein
MYFWMVGALMFAFPVTSTLLDTLLKHHGVLTAATTAKWFVFWAVGLRLLLAGLRQIIQPRYTAETILGIKDPDAMLVVRELGFANTAFGVIGVVSIATHTWILPTATAGAIFYGLAGVNHLPHKHRNKLENVAMLSDLFVAAVLLTCCLLALFQQAL